MRYLLLFCLLQLAAFNSNASVIYSLDSTNRIVNAQDTSTGTTMQWLRWDQSNLILAADFFSGNGNTLYAEGWRMANNTQMAALFNDFFGGGWLGQDTYQRHNLPGVLGDTDSPANVFQD